MLLESSKPDYRKRNLTVAVLLAGILPFMGAGHLYLGKVSLALIFTGVIWGLGGLWALFLLFSVIVISDAYSYFFLAMAFAALAGILVTWVWEVLDVRTSCQKINARQ
ncbi:MAG: hypothetical protein EXR59_00880 [Dehalococcoidia bacterium]|nr:hypothetical protein [Dehalococcoidia bacterium]